MAIRLFHHVLSVAFVLREAALKTQLLFAVSASVCVFLCASWFHSGWPSPLAPWPLWPFGRDCGRSICLLLSRSGGTGCNGGPPGSVADLPLNRPPASCSGPQIWTALPGGPQETQLEPFVSTHTRTHACTGTNTTTTHMLGKTLQMETMRVTLFRVGRALTVCFALYRGKRAHV